MIDNKNFDRFESLALAFLAGACLSFVFSGTATPSVVISKFNQYKIEWSHEFTNGTLLYRGIYEDNDYYYEVSDTTRDAVIEALKNMVNA